MAGSSGEDLREVLANRYPVVDALEAGPRTRPELVSELGVSRSTIDRSISDLQEVECVGREGHQYHLTGKARASLKLYQDYREITDTLADAGPLLNALLQGHTIDYRFLLDADVYSSSNTPEIALEPAIELLSDATRLQGTASVVRKRYFDVIGERLHEGDFDLELVLTNGLLESIQVAHSEDFEKLTRADTTAIYRTGEQLPWATWLIESPDNCTAGITIYEDGGLKGTIANDSTEAVEWLRTQYASRKVDALRVQ